jgi:hypothetical protein
MKNTIKLLLAGVLSLFISAVSHSAIVGPVNVLSQVNDGTVPAVCVGSLNRSAGGVAEMALDLDQDGIADICFGSQTSSCTAGFNYDALSLNTTRMMSTGGSIMNGTNATLTFWNEQEVGPFQVASGSISSANIGVQGSPMVFGFQGGSNTALTEIGYFSFTVNADCSINFGSVDIASEANTFSNAVVATPTAATPVPTFSEWSLIFLISLMMMFGLWKVRRSHGR